MTSPFDVAAQETLLVTTLRVVVPLWIERLKCEKFTKLQARAARCSQVVAAHGDDIQFKSKKRGATAEAFNALAEGLACASFAPRGVTFLCVRWETTRIGSRIEVIEEELGKSPRVLHVWILN